MATADWDEFPNPTLMRSARGVYAQSIRAHLAALGIDDLPRNGAFVLAGIGASGGPGQDLPAGLGVSKQAVSQVIEVLVSRGYLTRHADPGDRRRVVLELTGSGHEVVAAIERGVDSVDRRLAERVPADQIAAMRSALIALTEIKADAVTTGAGQRRSPGQLRSFSPIFPVRDLGAALAHYAALGFDARAYDGGDEYGFADRDGVGLHLAAGSGGGAHPGAAYLYVRDADALYLEWTRPGVPGHSHPVRPTPYGLREGSHVDPDGNLIRFGSPAPDANGDQASRH
jgi:DNA-binding MarR family transcriptional regulator